MFLGGAPVIASKLSGSALRKHSTHGKATLAPESGAEWNHKGGGQEGASNACTFTPRIGVEGCKQLL